MNAVAAELCKKHTAALFLDVRIVPAPLVGSEARCTPRARRALLSSASLWQIEAEVLHELTEAAKVESVPTFLILKAGAELHRIAGADVVRPRAPRVDHESWSTATESQPGRGLPVLAQYWPRRAIALAWAWAT